MSFGLRFRGLSRRLALVVVAAFVTAGTAVALAAPPLPGAIFTTNAGCAGVNINIFTDQADVYLNGGPSHPGAAGLPNGNYYGRVTEPNGTVLGKTPGADLTVVGGEFAICYQLSVIMRTASSGFTVAGYDTTSNPGGEYKVWVSTDANFPNNASKTDNFKVKPLDDPEVPFDPGRLTVTKFYDANANGLDDDGIPIAGWKVRIVDGIDYIRFTPVLAIVLDPDEYTVSEFLPVETNWLPTTATSVDVNLGPGEHKSVAFGNLCLGAGGGKTIGFWSNKNGQAAFAALAGPTAPISLSGLNLRNANGTDFDPGNYAPYRTWLLNATAENMAYMLSAQLSGTHLNVRAGFVNPAALIYAPGTTSANALGFATVAAVMAEANAELGVNGLTLAGHPARAYQEALKNALDAANNSLNFVQAAPCPFTFAE